MAALPTDQTRQFDYPPGRGRTVADALAAPPASMVAAATRADTMNDVGSDGTKAYVGGPTVAGATNTPRPAAGSVYITGGTKTDGTVVAANTTPAPPSGAHRDVYKTQNDTASVLGPGAPTGASAGAITATTAVLNWLAPVGGSYPPTGYRVEKSVKSGAVWGAWGAGVNPAGTALTATQTGTTGQDLRFRVFTVSGNRESTASNIVTVKLA